MIAKGQFPSTIEIRSLLAPFEPISVHTDDASLCIMVVRTYPVLYESKRKLFDAVTTTSPDKGAGRAVQTNASRE